MQGGAVTQEKEEEIGDLIALQGVRKFPIRIKCAMLGWSALQEAIQSYRP